MFRNTQATRWEARCVCQRAHGCWAGMSLLPTTRHRLLSGVRYQRGSGQYLRERVGDDGPMWARRVLRIRHVRRLLPQVLLSKPDARQDTIRAGRMFDPPVDRRVRDGGSRGAMHHTIRRCTQRVCQCVPPVRVPEQPVRRPQREFRHVHLSESNISYPGSTTHTSHRPAPLEATLPRLPAGFTRPLQRATPPPTTLWTPVASTAPRHASAIPSASPETGRDTGKPDLRRDAVGRLHGDPFGAELPAHGFPGSRMPPHLQGVLHGLPPCVLCGPESHRAEWHSVFPFQLRNRLRVRPCLHLRGGRRAHDDEQTEVRPDAALYQLPLPRQAGPRPSAAPRVQPPFPFGGEGASRG